MTSTELVLEAQFVETRQLVSPYLELNWNHDNSGSVHFWCKDAVYQDGVFVGMQDSPRLREFTHSFEGLSQRVFTITLPDGATKDVPFAELMLTIKTAFEELAVEELVRLYTEAAPQPPVEPEPEAP